MKKAVALLLLSVISILFCQAFTEVSSGLPVTWYSSLSWGDFDNDGDLDVLMTGHTGSAVISKVFRNNGGGSFADTGAGITAVYQGSSAWGDYDNDGDLDILLTGNTGSEYISIVYQNSSGNFTDMNAGLTGVYQSSVAWGDYDNDGDLDILLTGNNGSASISKVYRNDGDNVFTDINAVLTAVRSGSVAWGDYDNDGDLDILLTGTDGTSLHSKVFRNDGGDVFTDISASLTGVNYSSVAWGDYDNDGDLDILMTGYSTSPLSKVYRNDGSGVFVDAATLTGVYNSSAAWGNYDNDGDLDIVLTGSNGSTSTSKVFRNDGSNVFTDITAGFTGVQYGSAVWGDYDNDSDLDVLLTGYTGSTRATKLYRNNCATPNTNPNLPSNLAFFFNGIDTYMFSWNKATDNQTPQNGLSYNIYLSTVSGSGNKKSPMSNISNGYRKIVAIGNTNQKTSWTVKNLPNGLYYWSVQTIDNAYAGSAFYTERSFYTPPAAPVANNATEMSMTHIKANWQAAGTATGYRIDVDNDHDFSSPLTGYDNLNVGNVLSMNITGLVSGTDYYYRIRAYNSTGTGLNSNIITAQTLFQFSNADAGYIIGLAEGSVAWGDYDNDDDLDFLLTGMYAWDVHFSRIYKNTDGRFNNIKELAGVYASSVDWGDYDNDSDIDVLLTGWGSPGTQIYRNDGGGNFNDILAGLQGVYNSSLAWGDYDNDGDLDVLLTGLHSNPMTIIYRNDNGVFTDINAGLPGIHTGSVSWGDYDNDDDLDILLTGNTGSTRIAKIFRNDNGIFLENTNASLTGVESGSVAWGDYDNDGGLDILLTGLGSQVKSVVYRNNNDGTFTDISAGLTPVYYSSAVWGDYDNDGDLDILLIGYTGSSGSSPISKIYRNDNASFTEVMNSGLEGVYRGSVAWGDYDNDGDLDIFLTGNSDSGPISKIFRNNSETKNTKPNSPSKLVTKVENDTLKLSFNPSTDSQTPQNGLSYNINMLINGEIVTPGMSDVSNGFRKIVKFGNAGSNESYQINNFYTFLPQGEKRVAWKVQAVDNCFAGSEFASSFQLTFPSPRDLILSSKSVMTDTDYLRWEYVYTEYLDYYVVQIDDNPGFTSPIEETMYATKKLTQGTDNDQKLIYVDLQLKDLTEFDSLVNNETYYWRMKPVYEGINRFSIFSETPLSFVYQASVLYPPNAPISGFNPSADEITDSTPIISWNVATDPDGHAEDLYYICQIDTINTFTAVQYADTTAASISSIQVASALPEGYRYYYRVKTVDTDALQSVWSTAQNFIVVMPPQNLKINDDGVNVNLTWDVVPINSKGIVYSVYSSPNPNAVFPAGWTVSAAQLSTPSWSEPHSAVKKFYKITVGSCSK